MSVNSIRIFRLFLISVLATFPAYLSAGSCDAFFSFDDDLKDASGNGFDGQMLNKKGNAVAPKFVIGRTGKALQLGDYAVMRTYMDLHYDRCPRVTITAWLKVDTSHKRSRSIISTGSGHGPGIRASGTSIVLNGPKNGLRAKNVIRDDNDWFFVAGVWNFAGDTYTLFWRTRKVDGVIRANHKEPEEALWVGAKNDRLATPARGVIIDDLRVIGRDLTVEEIEALRLGQ